MSAPTLKLHAKLAEVMADVERIPKRGRAPAAMGGFEFVQVGDAADAIRKGLSARKVSMLPSQVDIVSENEHATKSGGTMTTQTIRTTWTLTDGETGEIAVIQSLGTGADTGDKFSPKAQTNSMKYALLMGFLLSTGEDPELSDSSDRRSRANGSAAQAPIRQPDAQIEQPDGSLIGLAQASDKGDADFQLRQVRTNEWPEPHPQLIFRLVEGRRAFKVMAEGPLAEMVAENKAAIEGQRATCWGSIETKSFPKDGKTITYKQLALARVKVGDLDLSAPEPDEEETSELTPEEEAELAQLAFPVSA